jgi:hypothetical protein
VKARGWIIENGRMFGNGLTNEWVRELKQESAPRSEQK